MAKKDVYERLCDYFSLQLGEVPDRNNLMTAFKQTVTEKSIFTFLF